ncbi:FMN-binding protein MioC [Candidatus Williamhamiltonella defendens]|uniref:FMN-binding protein MioC n=2 Tax=Candidatus Williamhamiltonella defendens TaxID=138072 RepID=A0A2D3T595_9ENTR|nr:FMN-binding protein MioC [Candidatus Hamiltonella defensa]ACQ66781.1 FMN-binding protein [Candidatus Hamiltonella defensa 5AT (Acyrthosiphon pisum)]ATW21596.1 FMN-binding protein MioC [Candidatus Hamiltonella defensa]ATW28989.1 FMN-binding protein MioC [Candidatus Hamiltonella defensa]ATW30956.1 FMN-binding protein MioC [Candidatus Hamiltonella defensa]ATW34757.1 FMN-binding protein MioC [Candidatus Hamiltonella defensa]
MTSMTFITGSTLGNSEYVAEHLSEKLTEMGFVTKIFHGPQLSELNLSGLWCVITSTHGAGDLPDNIKPLFKQIIEDQPDLSKIRFGSIGLGSSDYGDTFCKGIKKLDQQLILKGAQRIGEILKIDVIEHENPEDPAEEWIKNWINLNKNFLISCG